MMLDNNWYGHRYILSEFCELKDSHSFSSIQHGWSPEYNAGNIKKRKYPFYPFLCWSNKVKRQLDLKGIQNVVDIGAPYLYLCKLVNKKNLKPSGTIYYPSHNTITIKDVITNDLEVIEKIESLFEPPFTVSIYYADANKNNVDSFLKRGWNVEVSGQRNNKKTLYKIHDNLTKHKNVVLTEISTIMFYALYNKKKVRLIKNNKSGNIQDTRENISNNYIQYEQKFIKKYPDILNTFLDIDTGFEIAKEELGFSSMKSKADLKKILGWSSKLKKIIALIISKLFDLKYGKEVRTGSEEIK